MAVSKITKDQFPVGTIIEDQFAQGVVVPDDGNGIFVEYGSAATGLGRVIEGLRVRGIPDTFEGDPIDPTQFVSVKYDGTREARYIEIGSFDVLGPQYRSSVRPDGRIAVQKKPVRFHNRVC